MSDSPKMDARLKIMYVALPTAVVLLALIFSVLGRQSPPEMGMPPQKVIMGEVEEREITDRREYVAVLEADQIVDLRARVNGFLVSKSFQDGDLVRDGQLLFQIEPDQYQALLDTAEASVLSAQAQFDRATLDFNRTSDLYSKKTAPKSDFDRVKADYEMAKGALLSAEAARTQARLNLQYASIKAPFTGRISDTPYSVGSLLSLESGVLAQVVSLDPILVTFGISDKIITESQKKDVASEESLDEWQVRLRLGPDHYYDGIGRFSYVAPTVDSRTDTLKFKAKFANPGRLLRPGQIVTAVVEKTKPEKRLVLPKEAVLTDTQGNYVFMAKEVPPQEGAAAGRPSFIAEMRRVTIESGDILDKEYIIASGLEAGERFIVKGLMAGGATLRPGTPIEEEVPAESQASAPPEAAQ